MAATHGLVARALTREHAVDGVWHHHDDGQLMAVTAGLAVVRTPEANYVMPPGRLCWMPPGCPHSARTYGPVQVYSLHLAQSLCQGLPTQPHVVVLSKLAGAIMERLSVPARKGGAPSARERRLIEVLLDELADSRPQALALPMPRDARLQELVRNLMNDPADVRTLDEWADRMGMARRTLTRHFRAECGLPFGQWRQQVRIMKALQWLAEGQSVTTVGMSVGYDSASAFIAAFRKYLGVTPSQYQESGLVKSLLPSRRGSSTT